MAQTTYTPTKRFLVEGVSRRTGKGYTSGDFHNEANARDVADFGNRVRRSGSRGPIFWWVTDMGEGA